MFKHIYMVNIFWPLYHVFQWVEMLQVISASTLCKDVKLMTKFYRPKCENFVQAYLLPRGDAGNMVAYITAKLDLILILSKCFTTTFLHAHSWLNWVNEDDDGMRLAWFNLFDFIECFTTSFSARSLLAKLGWWGWWWAWWGWLERKARRH